MLPQLERHLRNTYGRSDMTWRQCLAESRRSCSPTAQRCGENGGAINTSWSFRVAGDTARLVGELPHNLEAYDPTWLRETVFIVRYVGDDATVDVQPELMDDYVIETVPIALVRSTQTPSPQ
jgi:hypothetical protein